MSENLISLVFLTQEPNKGPEGLKVIPAIGTESEILTIKEIEGLPVVGVIPKSLVLGMLNTINDFEKQNGYSTA